MRHSKTKAAVIVVAGFALNRNLNIHGPTKISYQISGSKVEANPDVVVETKDKRLYLAVQEDKCYSITEGDKHDEAAKITIRSHKINLN